MGPHAATLPPPLLLELCRSTLSAPPSDFVIRSQCRFSPLLCRPRLGPRMTRRGLGSIVGAATMAPSEPDHKDALEQCLSLSPDLTSPSWPSLPPASFPEMPAMKGGKHRAFGAATMKRSELDTSKKITKSSPEVPQTAVDGGGGDSGNRNFHGGGEGGDDGGDDDDYFDDFDDDDEGDEDGLFRRRIVVQELFDRKFVDAVLQEWFTCMTKLPAGLRHAYEMGLVSSAQMVRFLAMCARPTVSRAISRQIPEWLCRAFIGRMIADPSFLCKLILEETLTCAFSVWREFNNRKERIKQEWRLALINVLTAMTCNGIIVWSLAPCLSHGDTFRFDFQNTILKLPNNIFEMNYPMREFDLQKRLHSFFYKAAEFSLLGLTAGSVQAVLSNLFVSNKEERLSVAIPPVKTNALSYGSFLGLYTNMRYQLLNGVDRAFVSYFDVLGVAIFLNTALRIFNAYLGEASRHAWLAMEANPPVPVHSDNLLKSYSRPSDAMESSTSEWPILKNAAGTARRFLSRRGSSGKPDAIPPRTSRKRIVRR